jgi:hypothetical protein
MIQHNNLYKFKKKRVIKGESGKHEYEKKVKIKRKAERP